MTGRHKLYIVLILIASFLIQNSILPALRLDGATPNILLTVIVSYSLMRGSRMGLWTGFFLGLVMDLFFGPYLGVHALLYMYAGAITGIFQKRFYPDDIKIPLLLIGAADLGYNLIFYIGLFLVRGRTNFWFYLRTMILPELMYTLVVSIFLYLLILKIEQKLDANDSKGAGLH